MSEEKIVQEVPDEKIKVPVALKKPRTMLKNLAAASVKKIPKILPKPNPLPLPTSSTKTKLKAFLLNAVPVVTIPPSPQVAVTVNQKPSVKRKKSSPGSQKRRGSVTVEERNREAARRYRSRLKVARDTVMEQNEKLMSENKQLKETISKLRAELAQIKQSQSSVSVMPLSVNEPQFCFILPAPSKNNETH